MVEGRPNTMNIKIVLHDPDFTEEIHPDGITPYVAGHDDNSAHTPEIDDDNGLS